MKKLKLKVKKLLLDGFLYTARPQLQLHSNITKRETKDCQWMPVSVETT